MADLVDREARLQHRFEAVLFDWDGTAVPDRRADASPVRRSVEAACALGMHVAVVSGTHVENIDMQLAARPRGPGSLHLLVNRGSEVYRVAENGPVLVERRAATPEEDAALTAAAKLAVRRLAARGLEAKIVSERLNRRKIDLIPEPAWADPPKAHIAELLEAVEARLRAHGIDGLRAAVELGERAAADAGVSPARVTSDAKHIEIGLTDKADAARWLLAELWRRGIGPGLLLIVGDEMGPLGGVPGSDATLLVPGAQRATAISVGVEPGSVPHGVARLGGGPSAFLEIVRDQVARRRRGDVPELDEDPDWTLTISDGEPGLERVSESLLTLADGRAGTRGSLVCDDAAESPLVVAAGVYRGLGPRTALRPGPLWNRVSGAPAAGGGRRILDLHAGLLRQELGLHSPGRVDALLFSSLARPGTAVLRAHMPAGHRLAPSLVAPEHRDVDFGEEDGLRWMQCGDATGSLAAAASQTVRRDSHSVRLDRVASYAGGPVEDRARREALAAARTARHEGFERLLSQHRSSWAGRWESADVRVVGDPELQRQIRFALFHLMASVADTGEAAVGARGLTGRAYRGHVFWDADVFVLPFLAATHPRAARAMLEYRFRRLATAQAAAAAAGHAGARFPWESAAEGIDVTPHSARNRAGQTVPIGTGRLEEHIVADVAWAAAHYADWADDPKFMCGPGRRLLVETARYWASRVDVDSDGRAHIRGVIGPDEYHVGVDDNAFTNVMARWNLRRAATLPPHSDVSRGEREQWGAIADAIVDGYDAETGIYEQFAGFHDLEPILIADIAPRRPIAADLLLGPERVRGAQVVKQADVLMLHHLVPHELAPGSLAPNLDHYEPRTAHASSLSPGIHAALLARAGRLPEACAALSLAARIDLEDYSETTAGGLHLAAMGSVWHAVAYGFAGITVHDGTLRLDPHLPETWEALELRLRLRGVPVRILIDHQEITVEAATPVPLAVGGAPPVLSGSPLTRLRHGLTQEVPS